MKNLFLIFCLFLFSDFANAQTGDNQYYDPQESNDAFTRGEVPGLMNNDIPPAWIDDPDYMLLERHERACDRCKNGRRCQYQESATKRLAIKYGNQFYDDYQPAPAQYNPAMYYNPNIVVGGYDGYYNQNCRSRGGAYQIRGGYTLGGYHGGGWHGHHHSQNSRGLKWGVGVHFGN
jgi:hypothetical protein